MKNSQMLVCFGLFFFALLQIPSSNAFNLHEVHTVYAANFVVVFSGKTNPIYNVNLAPFIQRLSAYYCIYNESSNCAGNFNLTMEGWLNITESETRAFCDGGCLQHTHDVLQCVWYVLDDFKFENGATIKNLNDTINIGCEKGLFASLQTHC
ncbi:hypothetical protein Hanom_Chr08g00751491 [Helianthus anomalus]